MVGTGARGGELVHLVSSVCLLCVVRRTSEPSQPRQFPLTLAISYKTDAIRTSLHPLRTKHPHCLLRDGYNYDFVVECQNSLLKILGLLIGWPRQIY